MALNNRNEPLAGGSGTDSGDDSSSWGVFSFGQVCCAIAGCCLVDVRTFAFL